MEYQEFISKIDEHARWLTQTTKAHEVLEGVRERHALLFSRLQTSPNTYHNLRHATEVYERLMLLVWWINKNLLKFKPETIILMWEAALRHDDSHIWHTYRQEREEGAEMSNEELSAYIAGNELRWILDEKDIFTIRKLILSTSFWQDSLPQEDPKYRSYEPRKPAEMMLAFADVWWGAFYGWKYFLDESIRYIHESWDVPWDISEWILWRKLFVENIIVPRLSSIRKYLKKELATKLDTNILDILNKLDHMNNPEELYMLERELYWENR